MPSAPQEEGRPAADASDGDGETTSSSSSAAVHQRAETQTETATATRTEAGTERARSTPEDHVSQAAYIYISQFGI